MRSKPPYYRIYLLTVWQEQSRGPPERIIWRFRLEDPRTGWQQAFADAALLMAALQSIVVVNVSEGNHETEQKETEQGLEDETQEET